MEFVLHDINTRPRPRCLDATARITVMGEHGSGKTALVVRWLKNMYEPLEQGVYDMYTVQVSKSNIRSVSPGPDTLDSPSHNLSPSHSHSHGHSRSRSRSRSSDIAAHGMVRANSFGSRTPLKVQLLDTSPIEIGEFSELRTLQIEQSDAFILCFDCTAASAIDDLRMYKRKIDAVKSDPLILVCCTKTDLSTERLYGVEEITDLLSKLNIPASRYFEVSAKHGTNTNTLLYQSLSQIEHEKLRQREQAKSSDILPEDDSKSKSDSVATVSIQEEPEAKRQTTPETKNLKTSQQCCIIA